MNEGLTKLHPNDEEYARGEYIRRIREQFGRYVRIFKDSKMNNLTEKTYIRQCLGEWVKNKDLVLTPEGLEQRDKEVLREFFEAIGLDWIQPIDRIHLKENIKTHRKIVVVGKAGRGKTSLLYWAMQILLNRLESDETAVVPVYVPLKELQGVANLGDLKRYIETQFQDEWISRWLWSHVEKKNILLLLDGLDEVQRDKRLEFLDEHSLLYRLVLMLDSPQARIVLTCRDSVYAESLIAERLSELKRTGEKEGFIKMELKPFTQEQTIEYARQYFGDEQTVHMFLRDIEDPRGRLAEGKGSARYTHLASEPLYLHMLCWLWAGIGQAGTEEVKVE